MWLVWGHGTVSHVVLSGVSQIVHDNFGLLNAVRSVAGRLLLPTVLANAEVPLRITIE